MNGSKDNEQARRRGWVSALAPDAAVTAQTAFSRAGFSDPTLVLRWDEIVGPETARLARPLRLFGRSERRRPDAQGRAGRGLVPAARNPPAMRAH